MILDYFDITVNYDQKQYEFTPKIEGYTSYTVSFKQMDIDSVEDACSAVFKNIIRKIDTTKLHYTGNFSSMEGFEK